MLYDDRERREIERHELTRPRVGFAPPAASDEVEKRTKPLLWEGDQA